MRLSVTDFVIVMPVFFVALSGLIFSLNSENISVLVIGSFISLSAIFAVFLIFYFLHRGRK